MKYVCDHDIKHSLFHVLSLEKLRHIFKSKDSCYQETHTLWSHLLYILNILLSELEGCGVLAEQDICDVDMLLT